MIEFNDLSNCFVKWKLFTTVKLQKRPPVLRDLRSCSATMQVASASVPGPASGTAIVEVTWKARKLCFANRSKRAGGIPPGCYSVRWLRICKTWA